MLNISRKQMIGETRIKGPMARGASQTLPEGWHIEFIARGTRPPSADCHDTGTGEAIAGFMVSETIGSGIEPYVVLRLISDTVRMMLDAKMRPRRSTALR
jgi:hypothetical protein